MYRKSEKDVREMLRENAWKKYDSEKLQEMNSFCDKYKKLYQ